MLAVSLGRIMSWARLGKLNGTAHDVYRESFYPLRTGFGRTGASPHQKTHTPTRPPTRPLTLGGYSI